MLSYVFLFIYLFILFIFFHYFFQFFFFYYYYFIFIYFYIVEYLYNNFKSQLETDDCTNSTFNKVASSLSKQTGRPRVFTLENSFGATSWKTFLKHASLLTTRVDDGKCLLNKFCPF